MMRQVIAARLDTKTIEEIDAQVVRTGITRAEFMRSALSGVWLAHDMVSCTSLVFATEIEARRFAERNEGFGTMFVPWAREGKVA